MASTKTDSPLVKKVKKLESLMDKYTEEMPIEVEKVKNMLVERVHNAADIFDSNFWKEGE